MIKSHLVIEYGRDQNSYYCFDTLEAAREKAVKLIKDNALAYGDYEAYDDPEKALADGFDSYININGDLKVEIADCELFVDKAM